MNFSALKAVHQNWRDIRVIGKTIERDDKKYHIIGMTLSDEVRLYIIEPYTETDSRHRKGTRSQRRRLKEQDHKNYNDSYLHCREFCFGSEKLTIQGGNGEPLEFVSCDYGKFQLFFDMMSAGWTIPDWLESADWNELQLVTLHTEADHLPGHSPDMPITITHRPNPIRHLLEKTVTLHVADSRSFSFTDHAQDKVQCHINSVSLIDVWKDTARQFEDPELTEKFTPDQLEQAREHQLVALEQNCPEGMCYIGIEYECSKDLTLVFHSKEYLSSRPETRHGSACFLLMTLKPDRKTGTHGLPLKGFVIQTPVAPDTSRIPAELFEYFEIAKEWTETIL